MAIAREQLLVDEASENAGHGARMQPQEMRHFLRGNAGKLRDDSQYQPLRTGDAERRGHALRGALQTVFNRPQHAHEVERGVEWPRHLTVGLRRHSSMI